MEGVQDNPPGSGDLTGSLRLFMHIKENNIQYLIGLLVAHQMGILDHVWTYGTGVCA